MQLEWPYYLPLMTEAYRRFDRNCRRMKEVIRLVDSATTGVTEHLASEQAKGSRDHPSRRLITAQNDLHGHLEASSFLNLWYIVMHVTFAEAYLQDALADGATAKPSLMSGSQQVASFEDVQSASTLEELAAEMRRRWARGFLERGGPAKWIDRLTKLGAKGYREGLASELEEAWGVRHLVVHSAGVATREFCSRHPAIPISPGSLLELSSERCLKYIGAIIEFVQCTDELFRGAGAARARE